MLAAKIDQMDFLRYPLFASPKLDGIRCFNEKGVILSRKRKPIPNAHIQKTFGKIKYHGFDGELIVGSPTAQNVFTKTTSGVMSRDGEPDVKWFVFDMFHQPEMDFSRRYSSLLREKHRGIQIVLQKLIQNEKELLKYEEECVQEGYEGLIVRRTDGNYKYGRSTFMEHYLMKLKRFEDSDAIVTGWEEQLHNENPRKLNELGKYSRSSHKANKTPKGVLGKLHVRDVHTGVEFRIGTGFNDEERARLWKNKEKLKGKLLSYKFQPAGVKDKPRLPVFKGFRSRIDL